MKIQTIEIDGRRFVILPEEEFQELKKLANHPASTENGLPAKPKFAAFTPVKVSGIPASEMLLRDRR